MRRITTRNNIRECVTVFSKSAPQEACSSANRILECSLPHIGEKCGDEAVMFVRECVQRFTTTIDNTCILNEVKKLSSSPILGRFTYLSYNIFNLKKILNFNNNLN